MSIFKLDRYDMFWFAKSMYLGMTVHSFTPFCKCHFVVEACMVEILGCRAAAFIHVYLLMLLTKKPCN